MEGDGTHRSVRDLLPKQTALQAWRGSIRASQFIVAVQDYYRGKPTASVCALGRTEDGSDFAASTAASKLSCGEMQEGWAISYITINRWRPILEAFDEDASGWISVQNVNRFTSSRPATYTVLKWIAYWSVGEYFAHCHD